MITHTINRAVFLNRVRWIWLVAGIAVGTYLIFSSQFLYRDKAAPFHSLQSSVSSRNVPNISIGKHKRPVSATRSIEDLRVGDRVLALNPEVSEREREGRIEPNWIKWRRAQLEMSQPDGTLKIDLIRPQNWFLQNNCEPGKRVFLTFPEMGAYGMANVVSTEECPAVKKGDGQVVTATFAHPSHQILDVTIEGNSVPIGVTKNHLFWSADREEFLPIGEMAIGEHVIAFSGDAKRIIQKLPRPGPKLVYNLEVYGEHVYFVGEEGLLVHNTCQIVGLGLRGNGTLEELARSNRVVLHDKLHLHNLSNVDLTTIDDGGIFLLHLKEAIMKSKGVVFSLDDLNLTEVARQIGRPTILNVNTTSKELLTILEMGPELRKANIPVKFIKNGEEVNIAQEIINITNNQGVINGPAADASIKLLRAVK